MTNIKENETVLILSRREAESVCLGDDVVLTIVSVGNDKVRIGVQAPPGVRILRQELEIVAKPDLIAPAQSAELVQAEEDASPILLPTPAAIQSFGGPLRAHLQKATAQRRAA